LIFDTNERTFLLRDGISVEALLPTTNHLFFSSAETPGALWEMYNDAWTQGAHQGVCEWVTPWNDMGYKNMTKRICDASAFTADHISARHRNKRLNIDYNKVSL
jgi:hypothetical protein